jgi:uncharacterized damage-inducible protein DinB
MATLIGHDAPMTLQRETDSLERADLVASLDKHRGFLRHTLRHVSDEDAARRTTVSELSLGGIVKHVTMTEERWVEFIERGPDAIGPADAAQLEAHAASFRMEPGETVASLLDRYDDVAKRTDELVFALDSLDASHPLPVAPWFEPGGRWSGRRVLLHILAETAQHAGHADIVREALDGAKTMG